MAPQRDKIRENSKKGLYTEVWAVETPQGIAQGRAGSSETGKRPPQQKQGMQQRSQSLLEAG